MGGFREAHASTFCALCTFGIYSHLRSMYSMLLLLLLLLLHSAYISASAPFYQIFELFGLVRQCPRHLRPCMRTCACSGTQLGHCGTPGHLGTLSDFALAEFEKRRGGVFSCCYLRSSLLLKLSAAAFCGRFLQHWASTV